MENKYIAILLTALLLAMAPGAALAKSGLAYPHNFDCSNCHNTHSILGSTGFDNTCTACHNLANSGKNKPFDAKDAANPYGSITSARASKYQTSHNWAGSDVKPAAGASAPVNPAMTNPNIQGSLLCARCHNVHGVYSSPTVSKPFLRVRNDNDELCRDCHKVRDTSTHMGGSHPVNINYSTSKLKGSYNTTPANVNPSNPTSALKLVNGKIQCSTCHGLHYTDSRSGSYQNHSSFSRLSTSKGMLLRTDARGKSANDPNICTNCHAGKLNHNYSNQNIQCNDCHSGHVEYDKNAVTAAEKEPNKYLVRRYMNVSTSFGKKSDIRTFYRYTGAATKEFFLDGAMTPGSQVGVGICQACHNNTDAFKSEHYVDSSTTLQDNHKKCEVCHSHKANTGSFSGGCTDCHGVPPRVNARGKAANGYAVWSTTANPTHRGYSSPSGRVDESKTPHSTHADGSRYPFTCNECHKDKSHNSGNFQQVFPGKAGIIAGTLASYDKNSYNCSSMYCHSNAQSTPTYSVVNWKNGKDTITKGPNRCQSCHAGKNNSASLSGAHQKHAAADLANYACQNCHAATLFAYTAFDNNTGLKYPAMSHVNGSKDISYNFPRKNTLNAKVSGTVYNVNLKSCATIYCHSNGAGKPGNVIPTWTDENSGKCGACHRVVASGATAAFGVISSNAHFEHLSSAYGPKMQRVTTPNTCLVCHAFSNFSPEAAHVDGDTGVKSTAGSDCYKCHGGWQQGSLPAWTDRTRIACIRCHPTQASYSASRLPSGLAAPNRPNYTGTGHGKPAAPYNGMDCTVCHDKNSDHISGTLGSFVRLPAGMYTDTKGNGNNNLCADCHKPTGSAQNRVMFTHVTSVGEAKKGTATMVCAKCHDVHGSSNDHMIASSIVFNPASAAYPITYKKPVTAPYNFIQTSAPYRGICQVCHTNTMHFVRGRDEAASGPKSGTNTNSGVPIIDHSAFDANMNCLFCHPHNPDSGSPGTYAFYPRACDSCHGYPPVPKSFVKGSLNYSSAKFEDYSGAGGSHIVAGHVPKSADPGKGWTQCDGCHKPADHNMGATQYRASQDVKATVNDVYRFNATIQPKYTSNRLDGTAHLVGTCSNVSCHFQKTPKWGNKP